MPRPTTGVSAEYVRAEVVAQGMPRLARLVGAILLCKWLLKAADVIL